MKRRKKSLGLVRVLIIIGAGVVVVFGSLRNLMRTIKLAIKRF